MKKRDLSTTLGLIFGSIVIVIGMLWGQSSIKDGLLTFWDIASIFITVFGSFFSLLIAFPFAAIKKIPSALKNAFLDKQTSPSSIIEKFTELSKKARREGLLSLENEMDGIDNEFFKSGLQMVIDGFEPDAIREIMELEIDEMESRHQNSIAIFKMWAGLAPAYGMIGTLIGLIQMLKNLQDQTKLGPSMAVALITSFYGSVMSNFLFNPIASKLEFKNNEESKTRQMIVEGILSIQSGVNPRIVEEKLKTYLSPEERLSYLKSEGLKNVVSENE
jgi:chemotaxis protein MotA